MHKIWTIIKREYKETVFKKSFIILTLLTPLLMVAIGIVPSLLIMMESEEPSVISVYDESGVVKGNLEEALSDTLKNGQPRFIVSIVQGASGDEAVENQKSQVEQEVVDGFLYIPENIASEGELTFYSKNVANFDLNRRIRSAVNDIVVEQRIQESGLDPDKIKALTARVGLKTVKISAGGQESERDFGDEYFSTFIFVLILYVTLIIYGNAIMRSIIQEKTSRIIEVMLSSVNPFQMMAGKILGQGSVGLTQYVLWALIGIGFFVYGVKALPVNEDAFSFGPSIFVYFVLFYILGYFLFATLYAAIGAVTNNDQEAQQMSTPLVLMLVVPLLMLGFLVKNPDSTVVAVISQIPFFSPIIMFARINLATPPFWEIALSIVILVVSIIASIALVAKIYRVGILMYGKRPTLPEILTWIRK